MSRPEKVRLGEILIKQNIVTPAQLDLALEEQRKTGRKLGRVVVDMGITTEKKVCQALAQQLNLPFVDLAQFELDKEVMQILPEVQARRYRALVIQNRGSSFLVGMADPSDIFAYDELLRILRRNIQLAVIEESVLMQLLDRTYRLTEEISSLAQELQKDLAGDTTDLGEQFGADLGLDDAPVVKLLQTIFEDAVQAKASDIHVEPQENKLVIRFRIDGMMHVQTVADSKIVGALLMRLKIMAGLDISEKRLPQDGRFAIKVKSQAVDMRLSTLPCQYGESAVMRLLIQNSSKFNLDRVGMPPDVLAQFRKMINRPSGMVLVTGPTGSGKTTTLYSALAELNTPETKIITVEDPVEYRLSGIMQSQVHDKIGLDFPKVLRAMLRQDPDVVLVGEMRDEETAQTGLRAAMTGHLVLSTLHTNSAATAPVRLIDMGVPRFMVAMSIIGVMAQRLIRAVCEYCAEPHAIGEAEAIWLRQVMGDDILRHTFVRGRGCSHCNKTGYNGRLGLYELLEITKDLSQAANMQDTNIFIQKANQHLAGRTLRDQSIRLAIQRKTTLEEAMHADNQFDE